MDKSHTHTHTHTHTHKTVQRFCYSQSLESMDFADGRVTSEPELSFFVSTRKASSNALKLML